MLYRLRFYRDLILDRIRSLFGVPLECAPRGSAEQRAARPSPHEPLRFSVGGRDVLLCYGRPSASGRTIFGDLIPFGEIWRLGANEPTTLHLPFPVTIAGVRVACGKLSLYAIPGRDSWTLILNRATRQWGITRTEKGPKGGTFHSAYTPLVKRAEIARVEVSHSSIPHVEQLTARAEVDGGATTLLFEWADVQIRIPMEA